MTLSAPAEKPDAYGAQLLPVLQDALDMLAARDIGRLLVADRQCVAAVAGLRPSALARRGMCAEWPWQRASAVEAAMCYDPLGDPREWRHGPNKKCAGNRLEQEGNTGPCWLSGGTDWQSFQGGFRCLSEEGIRPGWVAFRVRVATPEFSGPFLTMAGSLHTWGIDDPVFAFGYRGDVVPPEQRRHFTVQEGYMQHGNPVHRCRPQEVDSSKTYDVAVRLDWKHGQISLFIDGARLVHGAPFKATTPIRYVALYNWRSSARAAFSELVVGNECPNIDQKDGGPCPHGMERPTAARVNPCCRRRAPPFRAPAAAPSPALLLAVGVGALAVAVAQWGAYSW